jgi:phosphatase NudJ
MPSSHGINQFKPNTTVAAIIHYQDKFLLVEEYQDNSVVFNQPAGHLEKNESILSALKREVFE